MDFLPLHTFRRCVARYPSNYPTKTFSHLDQYLSMAFAQLTFRESLRDIEVCLRAHEAKLYHLGIRGHVARSNLGDANEKRDWRIYRDFANTLIAQARRLYADDAFAVDLDNSVYALDTTLPIRLSPTATSGSVRPCSWTFTSVAIFGSHNRSQSSSDFFPTTRPAPPTWRRLAGATGLFAPIVRRRESRSASQIVLASCAAASAAVTPD